LPRQLLDILRALPDDNDVSLTLSNKRMSGAIRQIALCLANAGGGRVSTWPRPSISMPASACRKKPEAPVQPWWHFAMAQQDIRYYLNGLLLVVDGKNVIAVATTATVWLFAR